MAKTTTYLKDYTPPPFLVQTIDLRIDLSPEDTIVESELLCRSNSAFPHRDPVFELNGEDLILEQI